MGSMPFFSTNPIPDQWDWYIYLLINHTNQPFMEPIWKILVKLDHFPRDRDEHKKN